MTGVGLRLGFLGRFPTLPYSDFTGIVDLGRIFRDQGLAPEVVHWVQFNPGTSMLLSLIFHLPGDAADLARTATGVLTGLLGLLPFLLWRPFVRFGTRVIAGAALAVWPGQIVFSGVVAQENWALAPAIGLACLAVRRLRDPDGRGHPVVSAVLYGAAVAMRQEMLIVLLPLALPAALSSDQSRRRVDARRAAITMGAILLALAVQRFEATGRFAITTPHGGHAVLGAFSPGAFAAGWVDPTPIAAATEPEVLYDLESSLASGWRLAGKEFARRPLFHSARAAAQLVRLSVDSAAELTFWALYPLPPERTAAGARLSGPLSRVLRRSLPLLEAAFLVAVFLAWQRRDGAILALAAAAIAKFALHAIASPMGRLLVPAIALQILAVALATELWAREAPRRRLVLAAAAILIGLAMPAALGRIRRVVEPRELGAQRSYRFPLRVGYRTILCRVDRGRPHFMGWSGAALASHRSDPHEGNGATAVCRFRADRGPLLLRLSPERAPGYSPGRARVVAFVDGVETISWDLDPAAEDAAREIIVPGGSGVRSVIVATHAPEPEPGGERAGLRSVRFEFSEVRPAP